MVILTFESISALHLLSYKALNTSSIQWNLGNTLCAYNLSSTLSAQLLLGVGSGSITSNISNYVAGVYKELISQVKKILIIKKTSNKFL